MPSDLEPLTYVLDHPNTYQFLVTLFEDAPALVDYLENKCVDKLIEGPDHIFYRRYLYRDQRPKLQGPDFKMRQCVDSFGALSALMGCAMPLSAALAAHLLSRDALH